MSSMTIISAAGAATRAAAPARVGKVRGVGSAKRGGIRGGRFVVRAAEDDAAEASEAPVSQTRKRSPKPLPATFGEGKVTGKKTLPFQDPFEKKSVAGVKPAGEAVSPFDMPASALDAPAAKPPTPTPPAAAAPAAAPTSPFGAAAPPAGAKPASPFGAATPAKSPFGAAAPGGAAATPKPPAAGASPFADTSAFGAAPSAGASPFAKSGAAANPFGDAKPAPKAAPAEDDRSPWEKLPKPAMAQVVIVLSFTTIISLMLATFWVVVQVRRRSPSNPPASFTGSSRRATRRVSHPLVVDFDSSVSDLYHPLPSPPPLPSPRSSAG